MKTVALILLLIFIPNTVLAQQVVKCTEPIGVTTPCEGLLLPIKEASEGLQCLEADLPIEKMKREAAEKALKIHESYVSKLEALAEKSDKAYQEEIRLSRIEISTLRSSKDPLIYGAGGVLAGAVMVILVLYATKSGR